MRASVIALILVTLSLTSCGSKGPHVGKFCPAIIRSGIVPEKYPTYNTMVQGNLLYSDSDWIGIRHDGVNQDSIWIPRECVLVLEVPN